MVSLGVYKSNWKVRVTNNAQGTTEQWTNALPSYVMLRLGYRLSKPPKKR